MTRVSTPVPNSWATSDKPYRARKLAQWVKGTSTPENLSWAPGTDMAEGELSAMYMSEVLFLMRSL